MTEKSFKKPGDFSVNKIKKKGVINAKINK